MRPQVVFWVPKTNPSDVSHVVDAHEAFSKRQRHGDRPDGALLTGDGLVPKTNPSAAGEALQCRAGGAPVRRSEEIRRKSKASDFPIVRIS